MIRAQLYLVNRIIYFVPTATKGGIFSQMIFPILDIEIDAEVKDIGEIFIKNLENCLVGDAPPEKKDAFKEFLRISNVKSNKKLVSVAKCINVECEASRCALKLVGANMRYKAFMEETGIEPIQLDLNTKREEIGTAIKKLFFDQDFTTEITPFTS